LTVKRAPGAFGFAQETAAVIMQTFGESIFRAVLLLLAVVLPTACGKEAAAPAGRPPADVTTISVTPRDTPVSFEFVGQTQSSREVELAGGESSRECTSRRSGYDRLNIAPFHRPARARFFVLLATN
jgi:hypothetical protein